MSVPTDSDNLRIEVERIVMGKSRGTSMPADLVDLTAQLIEFTYYQSVFDPLIRATLVINDSVNLQYNYPLTGEEIIIVTLNQDYPTGYTSPTSFRPQRYSLIFCVENIGDVIVADIGKSSSFVMNLVSIESWPNETQHISLVNKSSNSTLKLEDFANYIFKTYIVDELNKMFPTSVYQKYKGTQSRRLLSAGGLSGSTPRYIHTETTGHDRQNFIIPNLNPIHAIAFCAKHAVATTADNVLDGNHSFLFYENLEGFHFRTIEGRIKDEKKAAYASRRQYWYLSNRGLAKKIPQLQNDQFYEMKLIANMYYNSKYETQSKVVGGYFQNRFVEINMAKQTYSSTNTVYSDVRPTLPRNLTNSRLNTDSYALTKTRAAANDDNLSRVRYNINNFINEEIPDIKKKWGKSTIHSTALNQIDISIAVPPDINLLPGDVIHINVPLLDSFTDEVVRDDIMSGYYFISEAKNVIISDGTSTTSLRLLRDGTDMSISTANKLRTLGNVTL